MKANKVGQLAFKEFHKMVLREAWKKFKVEHSFWDAFFTVCGLTFIIMAIVATVLEKNQKSSYDFWRSEPMITAVVTFLVFVFFYICIYLWYVRKQFVTIYNKQVQIITERVPDQLDLSIERIPTNIISSGGKDFKALGLLVKNLEKEKIVELQALVNFNHFDYSYQIKQVSHVEYEFNSRLFWSGEKAGEGEKEIELRPEIPRILLICELIKAKTEDGQDIDMTLMSSDPAPTGINHTRESIFQISIKFQGKLESEYDFRTFHYKEVLYAKPSDQRILFLDDAERVYLDIPKDLLLDFRVR